MRLRAKWSMMAASVLLATPAYASDKQDFTACDGRMHPGRQDDGMRGEASRTPYTIPFAFQANVVESCTRALASPRLLPTQTLRRAHLLRARAAAYFRAGDTAKTLADLDLAEAGFSQSGNNRSAPVNRTPSVA